MAFDITTSLRNVQSYLQALGYFAGVQIGRLAAPPTTAGYQAAIMMADAELTQLTVDSTVEVHTVSIYIYRNALEEPTEDVELELSKLVSQVVNDALGHFDLASAVANVEVGASYGTAITVDWDYDDIGGVSFRTARIDLPLVYHA